MRYRVHLTGISHRILSILQRQSLCPVQRKSVFLCGCETDFDKFMKVGVLKEHLDALHAAKRIFEKAVDLLGLTEDDKFHI